ncbi:hypothetical protein AT278_29990 [Bacillus cereus]|uniref:Uncharacterized protein n=2 Tax=Bacillus thuringiensis TaxID=1428 RepID=A0A1B2RCA9_BACTU|nr:MULTISPECIES: hypothetical protein [Bacillus cereus group]AOB42134.1 hypothetical protein pFR260_037c [Bacillus thuringiensis]KXY57775.1 hypothetical protein AT278_29990 [Bacillus cereus]OMH23733.1 hypothetical protein BUM91_31350 [Bacillus thuringiensis]OTX88368.1 hypothetical protein BK726_14630 [Bacillus thuringiensis serovar londrina]
MRLKNKEDRGIDMKKDKIWVVLDDPKEQETREQSQEPDDILAGLDELSEITMIYYRFNKVEVVYRG